MNNVIEIPNLYTKDGNLIPRTDYLDENGYADDSKIFYEVDHRLVPIEAYDDKGESVDMTQFYEIYRKYSLSDFIVTTEDGSYLNTDRIDAFKSSAVAQKTIHTQRYFENKVDITDPCFPDDAEYMEYRLALPIKAGTYDCITWKHMDPDDINNGRTMVVGIYLNGAEINPESVEVVGVVGVDTGTVGFFMNKPNYTEEQWDRIVRSDLESIPGCYELPWAELMGKALDAGIQEPDVHVTQEGFYSSIGWGDGEYHVLGYKENGEYVAFEIIG